MRLKKEKLSLALLVLGILTDDTTHLLPLTVSADY